MTKSTCITLALITGMSVNHVAAQTPGPALRVSIDVKPGDNPTSLEPKREGMVYDCGAVVKGVRRHRR